MIDLRSDTGTLPTLAMREAMKNAEVGDDGRGEDPTVSNLEALSAEVLGKEDALFCPSGTMANILAVLTQVKRGERIAVDKKSHMYSSEKSIFSDDYFGRRAEFFETGTYGVPKVSSVRTLLENNDIKLLSFENTFGYYGGTCITTEETEELCFEAQKFGVPTHIDGARLFNAAIYLNTPVAELAKSADTVMFCLSKGLGAPVGSVLCGTKEFIARARTIRKAIGGNMRQSGVVAAAGILALNEASRVKEDHKNTRLLFSSIQHNS